MAIRQTILGLGVAMACVGACGCGATNNVPTAHLQGRVAVDAEPIAEGRITFIPREAGRGSAVGAAITNGAYDCPNVPLGQVLVQLNATRETGQMDTDTGPAVPARENLIPATYRSGIEINVAGDRVTQDFLLNSR